MIPGWRNDEAILRRFFVNQTYDFIMVLYLGLDVGTQSCKALVWDSTRRRVVSSGQKAYDVISTRPGQAEQDPETWIDVRVCEAAV